MTHPKRYFSTSTTTVNEDIYYIDIISINPMVVLPGTNEIISVTVVDANGHPAQAGATVSWSCDSPLATLGAATSDTDNAGIATVTVTSSQSGITTVTATLGASSKAIVARFYDPALQPPFVPNGMDGELNSFDVANGVQLIVDKYPNATVGDFLSIYWGDVYHYTKEITNITTDFPVTLDITHNFPPSCLSNGSYCVFYQYLDPLKNSNVSIPLNLTVTGMTLPPPVFTEGDDGWIDAQEASSAGGTPLAIPVYPGIGVGDVVTTYWQGFVDATPVAAAVNSQTHTVTLGDLVSGFSVMIPTAAITPVGIGKGQGSYSVQFVTGLSGNSPAATINIDTVHSQLLPPPVFPEAVNGELDLTDAEDGTPMNITYPNMTAGDKIVLHWMGYEDDGITPVAGSGYSETRFVTQQEAQNQLLSTLIPAENITLIGDGYATGQYEVLFASTGLAYSTSTKITIMRNSSTNFKLDITTGAPYRHDPADLVRPCNVATVTAPPGTAVEMALPEGGDAEFIDSIAGKPWLWGGVVPIAGFVNASICSTAPGNVTVTAFNTADVTQYASRVMVFDDYAPGSGSLKGYGYSTGALANGKTVNTLYAWAEPDDLNITKVSFSVQGTATIVGYGQVAILNLSAYRTASVDVVDNTPEHSTFTINTMQSSVPSSVTDSVQFIPASVTRG